MAKRSSSIILQERDFEILAGLFECRVMTLRHVTDLYFEGRTEASKKRVQALKASGYLNERRRRVGDQSILHLGKKAFQSLRESGKLSRFPEITPISMEKRAEVSELTLRHELEVMDMRASFVRALRNHPSLSLVEFSTWPTLNKFLTWHTSKEFGTRELVVRPDGFICILDEAPDGPYEHVFFFELDRSNETLAIVAQKAACYLNFYKSGGMALRFGATREEFREFPFRVLMVFKTEERRNNAARQLLKNTPPILTHVWLSTYAEVSVSPLGAIWVRPIDFAEAHDPFNRASTDAVRGDKHPRQSPQKHTFL